MSGNGNQHPSPMSGKQHLNPMSGRGDHYPSPMNRNHISPGGSQKQTPMSNQSYSHHSHTSTSSPRQESLVVEGRALVL